jgi:hypothetical protein
MRAINAHKTVRAQDRTRTGKRARDQRAQSTRTRLCARKTERARANVKNISTAAQHQNKNQNEAE